MRHIKENLIPFAVFVSFFIAVLFYTSCSESTSPENSQGQITITMVDSPAGFDQINISILRVEAHVTGADSNNGWVVINNNAAIYDLLKLKNGVTAIIGNSSLGIGHYSQIRLIIGTGSNIVVDGVTYPLEIPSGEQTGIKLNHEFEIQEGLNYELFLDFDAELSILLTGSGQYIMNPVIRIIPAEISGSISGIIIPINSDASIYAQSGAESINTNADKTTGIFKLMAIIEGTYDVTVSSGNVAYKDTTISDVVVVAKQNTDLGTINLSLK